VIRAERSQARDGTDPALEVARRDAGLRRGLWPVP
jgi:hypothetical protein